MEGVKPLTTEVPNLHHIYQYIYHDFHLCHWSNIHQKLCFKDGFHLWPKNIYPKASVLLSAG